VIRAITVTTIVIGGLLMGGTSLADAVVAGDMTAGGWNKPVSGATVSQKFGCSDVAIEPVDWACPGHHWHSGIDLATERGTPVHAAIPGTARVIPSATGYGLHVVVDDGGGLSTLYGHLASVDVVDGQYVIAGEVIGAVGSSGNSTGPHLHFEVRRDGVAEDPLADLVLP
jgi:murein DD-endopeptidase MepM/ murein hydrolase activator NlpD